MPSTPADPSARQPVVASGMSVGERILDDLLAEAHLTAPHEVPALLTRHIERLGVTDVVTYLADLQQNVLVPFLGPSGAGIALQVQSLGVDATLAGRAFQHVSMEIQEQQGSGVRVWLPMLDGSDRLGVLAVTVPHREDLTRDGGVLGIRLRRLASLAAEIIMTKTFYGDTIVQVRRQVEMGLAAEIQWSLLPPLTFASENVTVAAALEPAYEVAGDTIDYAVDAGRARVAIFDGMGHGLQSAQLAVLAVASYRHARRGGRSLPDTVHEIDAVLADMWGGDMFATAVVVELDTDSGTLRWVNAGHPEPLLLRGGRIIKSLAAEPTLPLGLNASLGGPSHPVVGEEHLEPGDRVLFYTDGVVEARSPEGEFFGVQQLSDLVMRNLAGGLPAPETMRRAVRALLSHQQAQLTDDATLLLLEWRTGSEQRLVY